ncbi:MAG: acyl carrier protein [Isosphaeraceae bacterium]
MNETLSKINDVFHDVFDDDDLVVDRATTASDVEGWDSLMHVTLMVNVEKKFGLRFSSAEIASLKNVGELVDLVDKHTAAR